MICPLCHKHKQQLHAHLTRFHKLSKEQILSLFEPRCCQCAHNCRTQIFPWQNFVSGHNGFAPYKQLRDCKCGCGGKTHSTFLKGHNKRVFSEWSGKPSWNSGLSKETDSRVAAYAQKDSDLWYTKEYRNKQIIARSTLEFKNKTKENVKKQWQNEDYRSLMAGVCSQTFSDAWANNREGFLKIIGANYRARPNKFELKLLDILKSVDMQWSYVGDFSLIIGGKNPDFILEKTNKLVEAMGCYFHNCECKGMNGDINWPIRKQLFRENGYEVLDIWEHELSDTNSLMQKIQDFIEVT